MGAEGVRVEDRSAAQTISGWRRGKAVSFRYRHGDRPLDGYTILRGVGRGGFGEVYYAVSDGGREVALKSILHNAEIELRGVRHCINLKSPNLVSVFDVRTDENAMPWVVMEYVTGPSLRQILDDRGGPLAPREAAFVARELAAGLSYLHRNGVVHRDLKPENVFFEDGLVKIGDYGLSKFINASHRSSQTISVGTVHYMAPEIGSGKYGHSVDVYALGIMLFEMITGSVPFQGESFGEILLKHVTVEPDLSAVPEPFRAAIAGALRKKPEQRTASVAEVVAGIFEDRAIETSVSDFDPLSLSGAARKSPAVVPSPVPAPSPVVAPAVNERRDDHPAPAARQATPGGVGAAVNAPEEREPYLEVVSRIARRRAPRIVGALFTAVAAVVSTAVRIIAFLVRALFREDARSAALPAERPPGEATRVVWVFLGSLLLAGGACCLVAPSVISFLNHPDELLLSVGAGIALIGFSLFAFYRGVWARRVGFWDRTLRPFLLACLFNAAAISAMIMVVGPATIWDGSRYGVEEEFAVTLSVLVGAVFLFGFTTAFSALRWRLRESSAAVSAETPRHCRPPPGRLRVVALFLGGAMLVGAFISAVASVMARPHLWDQFGFLAAAVTLAALALALARVALRRERGRLWAGAVRPFVVAAIFSLLVISVLPPVLGLRLGEEERLAFIALGLTAAGLAFALAMLRLTRRLSERS